MPPVVSFTSPGFISIKFAVGSYKYVKKMLDEEKKLEDFLEDESKSESGMIRAEVKIYPSEGIYWRDNVHLKVDGDGEKYMETEGKLAFIGKNTEGKEQYRLKGKVGNFNLLKEGDKLRITNYFRPELGGVRDNEQ